MNNSTSLLFPHRIGRLSYALRYSLLIIGASIGAVLFEIGAASGDTGVKIVVELVAIAVMMFALVALFRSVLLPRLRDVGLHGAWSLLTFLPLVNVTFVVALLFISPDALTRRIQSA